MLKQWAYKLRLKPNERQARLMTRFAGCSRVIWNHALAFQKARLERGEYAFNYCKLAKQLPIWKEEMPYLKETVAQSLQQTLKDLSKALREAFDKDNPKRFPKFKQRGQLDSFRYPQGVKLDQVNNRICLYKLGWVRYYHNRPIEGKIKNVTISRHVGHWYASVQVEMKIADPIHPSTSAVGIDMGIMKLAVCSDGQVIEPVNSYKKHLRRLSLAQHRLDRKVTPNRTTGQKASKNWKKQLKKVQRLHKKMADTRRDYLHKATHMLALKHRLVVLEDIKVGNLSASPKGTVDKPGKQVKQKAGLNKAILDQGWYEFRRQLAYKEKWLGGAVRVVSPPYTSQRCYQCGHTEGNNRRTQSEFVCVACGHTDNADLNAAKNILAAGQAVSACESSGASRRKQEPTMSVQNKPCA